MSKWNIRCVLIGHEYNDKYQTIDEMNKVYGRVRCAILNCKYCGKLVKIYLDERELYGR